LGRELNGQENAPLILGVGLLFLLVAGWPTDPVSSSVGALLGGGSLMFGSFVHRRVLAAVPAERFFGQLGLPLGLVAWLWNVSAGAMPPACEAEAPDAVHECARG